ncbi:MAG: chalcone isomerase family protein [Burkholderiales bacterium]|nr:chalcone isomerase family protein [Burkholderiales bacterium]
MLLAAAPVLAEIVPPPARVASPLLAQPRQVGSGLYSWWGFDVYQASLWAEPGFDAAALPRQRYALELHYRRDFKGRDIAQRSIDEMRRVGSFSDAQAQAWLQAMVAVFPDVSNGDRLTGVNLPGRGAQFYANGKPAGEIADPEFARLFFGIWLSEQTSAPKLRLALLGQSASAR